MKSATSTILGVVIIVGACGGAVQVAPDASSEDGDTSEAGLDSSSDWAPDALDAAPPLDSGACNALVQLGDPIDITLTTAPVPAPQGGDVIAGTYVLTAINDYGTSSGTKPVGLRATLDITGTTMQYVDDEPSQATFRGTIAFTTSGADISQSQSCPAPATASEAYTATNSELRLQSVVGPHDTVEYVYAKK